MMRTRRSRNLSRGLDSVTHWRVVDENHLPVHGKSAPGFHRHPGELDALLRRPSLNEQLSDFLMPAEVDPDLLEPGVRSQALEEVQRIMKAAAQKASGQNRKTLVRADGLLSDQVELDLDVDSALAAFLKG